MTDVNRDDPQEADKLLSRGHSSEDAGDFEDALAQYRAACLAAPRYARTHMNLGNALRALGRNDDAIGAYQRAVDLSPESAEARFNLALQRLTGGDVDAARDELVEAMRLQPGIIEAHLVLADILERQGKLDEAEASFIRALGLDPVHSGARLNYGTFCERLGRPRDASRLLEEAKALDPGIKGVESPILFGLNFGTDLSAEEIAQAHRRMGAELEQKCGSPFQAWSNVPDPERRLRLAYVSGDFHHHPVSLFLRPVLEHHDPVQLEVVCYSNRDDDNDVAAVLRRWCSVWRNISSLGHEEFARMIREDGIDVLVDLAGHTHGNRLSTFALHPAPVQASWLGYLNTSGLSTMDYRICDQYTDPTGETDHLYTETLVRMPHAQWCYQPWYVPPSFERAKAGGERTRSIVFGSFNQYPKITDDCLKLWGSVLKQAPDSRLLILDVRPALRTALENRLERHGIDPRRVQMHNRQSINQYFESIASVDIALDTFPYNGATTTLDTLWMGVPLVALRGDRPIARGSYSILSASGLDELIARSETEYVDINLRLARNHAERAFWRKSLRPRLEASPLVDASAFTRALEAHFRSMWRLWCARHANSPNPSTLEH